MPVLSLGSVLRDWLVQAVIQYIVFFCVAFDFPIFGGLVGDPGLRPFVCSPTSFLRCHMSQIQNSSLKMLQHADSSLLGYLPSMPFLQKLLPC
jgi:hypothetical protein